MEETPSGAFSESISGAPLTEQHEKHQALSALGSNFIHIFMNDFLEDAGLYIETKDVTCVYYDEDNDLVKIDLSVFESQFENPTAKRKFKKLCKAFGTQISLAMHRLKNKDNSLKFFAAPKTGNFSTGSRSTFYTLVKHLAENSEKSFDQDNSAVAKQYLTGLTTEEQVAFCNDAVRKNQGLVAMNLAGSVDKKKIHLRCINREIKGCLPIAMDDIYNGLFLETRSYDSTMRVGLH